ncbi:MAG TPA: ABC transporter permease [Bryobacteraceae bacterium]|nr:ABC transporter permease [Bryobacteraceae bacterium]
MLESLRYALRILPRSPGFTLVAICSLAIGIGATSAMFTFADALLLRPLPVREPGRIAAVATAISSAPASNPAVSYPDYRDFRDANRSFDGLIAASFTSVAFKTAAPAAPRVTFGFFVTGNFFRVLGVEPAPGRGFRDSEDQAAGRDPVVVLGHDFWKTEFNANPAAVGSTIWLNGVPCTVIGVAPQSFTGIDQVVKASVFVPLAMSPRLGGVNYLEQRDYHWLTVKGRLKPRVTIAQANADLAAIAARLEQLYPRTNRNRKVEAQTEFQFRRKQSPGNATLAALLLVLAVCVLAVASANVTGLLLARGRGRAREMAVRLAVGAGRGTLIRQLLVENLLLALAGGIAGIAIAYAGARFLNALPVPSDVPLAFHAAVDRRMLLFTVAASLLSTLLFGLTPALQSTRVDLVTSLKAFDADSGGRPRLWGRNAIVVGQVAVSLLLLIVSAVLLHGFRAELSAGPGFRTDHLYLTTLDTQPAHYSNDQTQRFFRNLLAQMRIAPGVRSAALTSNVPLYGTRNVGMVPEGYSLPRGEQPFSVPVAYISEGYFATMDIPVLRGRGFQDSDRIDTPLVAVVNEQFGRHYWPREDALGKRFHLRNAEGPLVQIVGIARMSKYVWIAEPPQDFVYLPYTQDNRSNLTLVVESAAPDAASLVPVVRGVIRQLDPEMPSYDARTMRSFFEQRAAETPNMIAQSVAGLGLLGLILAIAGLYALIAYAVSRRAREIGIRMAIGATPSQVIRMVLGQGLWLGGTGLAAGLILSFFACRALTSLVFIASFRHLDYGAFPAIASPLLVLILFASYLPARRASRIDPVRTLRAE